MDENIEDNTSDRLSLNYGAELYSMVDSEEQKEIAKRNSLMRDKAKTLRSYKAENKKEPEKPGSYININTESYTSNNLNRVKDYKVLRNVLDLYKLHYKLRNTQLPFPVILDVELNALLNWLRPTTEEKIFKEQVLLQLEIVVNALFPDGKLKVFGSYATGLSLPGGDIDACVQSEGDPVCILNMVIYTLNRLGLVHSFDCVYNTQVPVVKFVDKRTGVRVDLSVYNESAFKTTKFIQEMLVKYKYMQPLIILIKFFLQCRNLGDTYTGGVGSYLLYCMVLSFLQLHDSSSSRIIDQSNSLSTLFVDFFYYWGFIRDYNQFSTTVRGFGHVYPRKMDERSDNLFSCDSPTDYTVDLGANSFNMPMVVNAFQNAFMILKNTESNIPKWFPSKNLSFEMNFSCIIESLYDMTHPVFQYRKHTKSQNLRKDYLYDNSKTLNESLKTVLDLLRKLLDVDKSNTYSAQRQLIEPMSMNQHELGKGTEHLPFYVLAEVVSKRRNSTN